MLEAEGAEREDRVTQLSGAKSRPPTVSTEVSYDGLGKQGEHFPSPQMIIIIQSSLHMGGIGSRNPPPRGYQNPTMLKSLV